MSDVYDEAGKSEELQCLLRNWYDKIIGRCPFNTETAARLLTEHFRKFNRPLLPSVSLTNNTGLPLTMNIKREPDGVAVCIKIDEDATKTHYEAIAAVHGCFDTWPTAYTVLCLPQGETE